MWKTLMDSDAYYAARLGVLRRMYDRHGQWIGTADAEAALAELHALDCDWRDNGPRSESTVRVMSESWGT
jgi:hypothetical protein